MEELLKKPLDLKRIEFWFVSVLYVFSMFLLVSRAVHPDDFSGMSTWWFKENHVAFTYFGNYFIPSLIRSTSLYCAFLVLTLTVVPGIINRSRIAFHVFVVTLLFAVLGLVFFVTDTWLRGWLIVKYDNNLDAFYEALFIENMVYAVWLLMMFTFYWGVKFGASYVLQNTHKIPAKYQAMSRECVIAAVLWMIVTLLLLGAGADSETLSLWIVIGASAIALYWYSFHHLIPDSLKSTRKMRAYFFKVFALLIVTCIPVAFFGMIINSDLGDGIVVTLFNAGFQLLITAPFAWIVYKRTQSTRAELVNLKTELGLSNAGLDFLRSQINPHFLFNALNTLYGTALQENSERTANGIQRLGDMMRFMIHENHQDVILLSREIDYLRNYIDLQLLRTQSSPDIRVETNIEDSVTDKRIAPMLLIPFVENAFKHGISLSKPSFIKMTLFSNENELYFDVYNSIHPKNLSDPEKDHSGIGLENVKQRLALLYPDKHKLIIRETTREFFVHLTITF